MPADDPLATCPKAMTYGPCGGVELDGTCEVSPDPCVFLDVAPVSWGGPDAVAVPDQPGAAAMRELMAQRPIVVVDLPAAALSTSSITACAEVLRGRVDAVLAGDSGAARVQFPPAYRAHLLRAAGLQVWTGLNNRDRNRVALEGELAALADVGVGGVHCVTGDHTDTGHRPDAMPVFDLDSTRTASLARRFGHLVSVGEAPCAPPTGARPGRLLEKERAGAEVCFVNHCGGVAAVESFVSSARALGSQVAFIACVPIVLDEGSAAVMESFTTSPMPEGYLASILGAGPDPAAVRAAGIAAAVDLARRMLDLGIAGVNLSGGPAPGGELAYAEAVAEIADRV